MKPSVLVVCGEDKLRASICSHLVQAKMNVLAASDAKDIEASFDQWPFDIVLCDMDMPDSNGGELVTRLRFATGCGVIALSPSGGREAGMLAMRLGADHYHTAPVDHEELEIVIRNLHRRIGGKPAAPAAAAITLPVAQSAAMSAVEPASKASHLVASFWQLDMAHWTLICPDGQKTSLSFPEYQVLHRLTASPGQVVGRDDLLALLGHGGTRVYGRNLDMMMSRLRRKVLKTCEEFLPIQSARGVGYVFNGRVERLA